MDWRARLNEALRRGVAKSRNQGVFINIVGLLHHSFANYNMKIKTSVYIELIEKHKEENPFMIQLIKNKYFS